MSIAQQIEVSVNSVGTWYDNGPMESLFESLKAERVHHVTYHTRREARQDLSNTSNRSTIDGVCIRRSATDLRWLSNKCFISSYALDSVRQNGRISVLKSLKPDILFCTTLRPSCSSSGVLDL